jgi:hypothetical protein
LVLALLNQQCMRKEQMLLKAVTVVIFTAIAHGFVAKADSALPSMTVSPSVVSIGATNNFTFSFRAPDSGNYDPGSRVTLRIPYGWVAPQTNNPSALGFIQLTPVMSQTVVSIRSINGTGPWTITVDITTHQTGAGFNLTYSTALSPMNTGVYNFKASTKGAGGALTSLKMGSPTVNVIDLKKVNTATALTSTANPLIAGKPVTFNALVTPVGPGTPSGSVTFMDGDVVLGSSAVNASGLAALSLTDFSSNVDTHWISAEYLGDGAFNGSVSSTLVQVVQAPQAPTIDISMNPDGSARLLCSGLPGQTYSIQAAEDLSSGSWVTISTNVIGTNGLFVINDPDAPEFSSRFYRTAVTY